LDPFRDFARPISRAPRRASRIRVYAKAVFIRPSAPPELSDGYADGRGLAVRAARWRARGLERRQLGGVEDPRPRKETNAARGFEGEARAASGNDVDGELRVL